MPNEEIDDFTEDTTPADDDLLVTVDVSDTTDSPQGTTKKVQAQNLVVKKVRTSTGPTVLTVGAVGDGEVLKRSGGSIIGAAVGGGGVGDFVGPASSVDNTVVRFDGTTGKLGQGSTVIIDDDGSVTVPEIAAPATPAAGKVVLYAKTDGLLYSKDDAGVESGLAGGGGTPAGSNKHIQFNDGGAFGGLAEFSFDKTAHVVTLGQSNPAKIGWSNTPGDISFGGLAPGAVGTIKVIADVAGNAGSIYSPLTAMTNVGGEPRPFLGLAGQVQEFAMTTNRSMGQVGTDGGTAAKDGTFFTTIFTQDATGSRLLTWHSSYKFPGGISIPLSTGPNAIDIFIWLVRNSGTEAHLVYHSLDSK